MKVAIGRPAVAKEASMRELAELQVLLSEIAKFIDSGSKSDRRKAADGLKRVAAIATTLGFTIRPRI